MENVIVVKDLLYAKDKAGATSVALLSSVQDDLENGAIGIYFSRGGVLIPAIVADADYLDEKDFVIAWNVNGTVRTTKGIQRRGVQVFNEGGYIAPVMHVVQAGGTTAAISFGFADSDVGDVSIRVADNTFTGMYATTMNNASVYKKASMTVEETVDLLIAKLNANTMLPVTAVKIGAAPDFGITIESTTRGQILSLTGEGLLQGMNRDVDGTNASVLPVNGAGVDEDVLKHEEDGSIYWGNSFSRELTTGWYSQSMATIQGETYYTISFFEELQRPYGGETNVKPAFTIYVPDGAATLLAVLLGIFGKLIGGAYDSVSSAEPGDD